MQTSFEALHFHFHFFYLKAQGAEICPMPHTSHTIIVSKICGILISVHLMNSYHMPLIESCCLIFVFLSLCSTVRLESFRSRILSTQSGRKVSDSCGHHVFGHDAPGHMLSAIDQHQLQTVKSLRHISISGIVT